MYRCTCVYARLNTQMWHHDILASCSNVLPYCIIYCCCHCCFPHAHTHTHIRPSQPHRAKRSLENRNNSNKLLLVVSGIMRTLASVDFLCVCEWMWEQSTRNVVIICSFYMSYYKRLCRNGAGKTKRTQLYNITWWPRDDQKGSWWRCKWISLSTTITNIQIPIHMWRVAKPKVQARNPCVAEVCCFPHLGRSQDAQ